MRTKVTNLAVFVASPSDIVEERILLKEIIDDANKLYSSRFGIQLSLIKWETDTFPSVGGDPQRVINGQIGDNYDIFIGILWARFGTPTKRAESGTKEEFLRAYKRAREKPNSIRLMMYFNNTPIAPNAIDAKQLAQVSEFKNGLGEQGVYWWPYNGIHDFERYVRLHLSGILLDYGRTWGHIVKSEKTRKPLVKEKSPMNGKSKRDILALANSAQRAWASSNNSIINIANSLRQYSSVTMEQATRLESLSIPVDLAKVKDMVRPVALSMEVLALRTEVELPKLSASFREGIDFFLKIVTLRGELGTDMGTELDPGYSKLKILRSAISEAQDSVKTLKGTIERVPAITSEMLSAKNSLLGNLERLLEEYATEKSLVMGALKLYEKFV